MIRFRTVNMALALLLILPLAASAQRETAQTREGSKFIGLAMTKQTVAEKTEQYQQAMTHLRQGMAQDAQNPRVWLLAGTALAGLGEMQEADRAFDRALELNPGYAEDIKQERFDAWVAAFQRGLMAMESEQLDVAIREMEGAEQLHQGRPEAQLYLGILYANHSNDYMKAEQAFRAALEGASGPLFAELDEEGKAEWLGMQASLKQNIERMLMMQGVTDFSAQRHEEAAARFRSLTELNAYSRDGWFNLSQALLAQAQRVGQSLEGAADAEAAAGQQRLIALYTELEAVAKKTQELDPNNEMTYLLIASSHRERGRHGGNEEAASQAALAVLEAAEALPVSLDDINMEPGEGSTRIAGMLKNRKLATGTPVRISFTLLGLDGSSLGQETVTVNAPEAEATTAFEVTVPHTAMPAGWKYTVAN